MIITFGGIKGGSGKTTLATNTACILSKSTKVLLVDADDQQTASDWVSQRENTNIETNWTTVCLSGANVQHQIKKLAPSFDYVIIDTGGRDTSSQRAALLISHLFITPFQPRSFDIWTMRKLSSLIEEAQMFNEKLQSYAIINRGDCLGRDNEDTRIILSEYSPLLSSINFAIQQRKAFSNAAAEGLAVIELKKRDAKAEGEINTFIDWLLKTEVGL